MSTLKIAIKKSIHFLMKSDFILDGKRKKKHVLEFLYKL